MATESWAMWGTIQEGPSPLWRASSSPQLLPSGAGGKGNPRMVEWGRNRQRSSLGSREGDSISHGLHQCLCVLETVLLMQHHVTYHKCGNAAVCSGYSVMFKFLICVKPLQYRRPLLGYLSRKKIPEWSPLTFGSSGSKLTFPQHCGASLISFW